MKKTLFTFLSLLSISLSSNAQSGIYRQRLFEVSNDSVPYRIPAIASCKNGNLIAVSDYRYCRRDIGFGPIDLHYRISKDYGKTWSKEMVLADGTGNPKEKSWNYAFGDCAIAADYTSNKVIILAASGAVDYFSSNRKNPILVAMFSSNDNGKTWDKGKDITKAIYGLFDKRKAGPIQSLFVTSGKIFQSRKIKVGKYYRLYAALCTRSGNFVIYSDDFGTNWKVLGDIDTPCCKDGDEAKCEETPNGDVIISSRTDGRIFNVYTFTNIKDGKGHWGLSVRAKEMSDIQNSCNGEIIVLPVINTKNNKRTYIAIQSIPNGPQRTHVSFWFKELNDRVINSNFFSAGWKNGAEISNTLSAYSTMTLQKNGYVGFLWEEGPVFKDCGYNIDYESYSIEAITKGEYKLDKRRLFKS